MASPEPVDPPGAEPAVPHFVVIHTDGEGRTHLVQDVPGDLAAATERAEIMQRWAVEARKPDRYRVRELREPEIAEPQPMPQWAKAVLKIVAGVVLLCILLKIFGNR